MDNFGIRYGSEMVNGTGDGLGHGYCSPFDVYGDGRGDGSLNGVLTGNGRGYGFGCIIGDGRGDGFML